MASIYNVSVPLSFSLAESEEIYQRIYDNLNQKLSINLSKFIFESDQGRSLNSFVEANSIYSLVCNRYLLVSLKKKIIFSFQIGMIVKYRNQLDLDRSMKLKIIILQHVASAFHVVLIFLIRGAYFISFSFRRM